VSLWGLKYKEMDEGKEDKRGIDEDNREMHGVPRDRL
jgi:hypothetical protein